MLGIGIILMIVVTFTNDQEPDQHQQKYETLAECQAAQNQLYAIATKKGFIVENNIATFGVGCILVAPKVEEAN